MEQGGLSINDLDFYLDETNEGFRRILILLMSKVRIFGSFTNNKLC